MRKSAGLFLTLSASLCLAACAGTGGSAGAGGSSATKPAAAAAKPAAAPGGAAAASSAGTAAAAAAPAAKLDDQGYIRNWLILAPINFGTTYLADDIDKEQIPSEATLAPKAGDKQKVKVEEVQNGPPRVVDKELTWQPVAATDHILDFNQVLKLEGSESIGGYAVAYLDAPEEMKDVTFSLSSNDNGKIFLNGKDIWKFIGGRALEEDSDKVDGLTLKKGINVVVFKVWNDSSNWQACLRLLQKDGKPITNVTVKQVK